MSLLDKASLIVTPNAYKASKLYSVIPSSGAGDMSVVRATTATRVNSLGLIESVAVNVPRIDYTNGSCPSLLVEPQRTNLFTYSEQFDNIAWSKFQATVTANNTTSPEGTSFADKLESSTNGTAVLFRTALTGATASTISVYAKAGTNDILDIGFTNVTDFTVKANLTTGTITSATSGITGTITNVGNGWYRVTATRTMTAIGTAFINSATNISGRFIYIWGAQLEVGSYATSYIPTVASSVTRNADVISKTGISSLIGQTEGTIFLEADIQKRNASDFYIGISNGYSLGEAIYLNQPSSGNLNVLFRTGVLTPTISILSADWNIGNNKIAIAYNSTLGEVFINGVSKGTVALTAVPTCNQIALASRTDSPGGLIGAGLYKQAILFKTRLSNTELAQLTTL